VLNLGFGALMFFLVLFATTTVATAVVIPSDYLAAQIGAGAVARGAAGPAVKLRRRARHVESGAAASGHLAGGMFWLRWKRLSGSYVALTSRSRS